MENVLRKEYINIDGQDYKIKVYYSKGGINCFTYRNEPRGYYLSVSPVKLEQRDGYSTETIVAFSGIKNILLEVNRKSNSSAQKALDLANNELVMSMIEKIKC